MAPNRLFMWKKCLFPGLIFAMLIIGFSAMAAGEVVNNPIKSKTVAQLVLNIADVALQVGSYIAVVAIIFAGFKLVVAAAQGNEGELSKARQMLWWVLIGTAIIVGARVIAQAVINTFENL